MKASAKYQQELNNYRSSIKANIRRLAELVAGPLPPPKLNANGCRMTHYVNYGEGNDFENVGTIYWRCTTQGHNHYYATQVTDCLDNASLQPFYDLRALHDLSGRKYSSKGMATEVQRTRVVSSLIEKATHTVQDATVRYYGAPPRQIASTSSTTHPIVPLPHPPPATPKQSRLRTMLISPPPSSPLQVTTPVVTGKRKAAEPVITPPPKRLKSFPCPSPIMGDRQNPIDVDDFDEGAQSEGIEFL